MMMMIIINKCAIQGFNKSVEEDSKWLLDSRLHDFGFRGCECVCVCVCVCMPPSLNPPPFLRSDSSDLF